MPGLFGIISTDTEQLKKFSKFCQSYLPFTYKVIQTSSYCIGAHTLQGLSIVENSQHIISVDGEHSIYQALVNSPQELFSDSETYIKPTENCKGNLCIFNKILGTLHFTTDILGSLPLYYSISENSFIFSSRIKAIGHFLNAEHDNTGIMEFLLRETILTKEHTLRVLNRYRASETLTLNVHSLTWIPITLLACLFSAYSEINLKNKNREVNHETQ